MKVGDLVRDYITQRGSLGLVTIVDVDLAEVQFGNKTVWVSKVHLEVISESR